MEKNSSIEILSEEECTGCGLCVNICPTKAIEWKMNYTSFFYPKIIKEKCINCGLCLSSCKKETKELKEIKKSMFVFVKEENFRKKGASGGFSTFLMKNIIENGGVVCGCTLNEELEVKHLCIEKKEDIYIFQDSKYVQSYLGDIYNEIDKYIKNKRQVLFVGTPCQVKAIKEKIKSELLITCDLVCHGVPSYHAFNNYIEYLEKKHKDKVIGYRFRNKNKHDKYGYLGKLFFEKREEKDIIPEFDPYYYAFIKGFNCRKSCYYCNYSNIKRIGDFTLGDTGTWKKYLNFYPNEVLSLVTLNTEKAIQIFDSIKEKLEYIDIDIIEEKKVNHCLSKSTLFNEKEWKNFYSNLDNFDYLEKYYHKKISLREKIKIILIYNTSLKLRQSILRLLK